MMPENGSHSFFQNMVSARGEPYQGIKNDRQLPMASSALVNKTTSSNANREDRFNVAEMLGDATGWCTGRNSLFGSQTTPRLAGSRSILSKNNTASMPCISFPTAQIAKTARIT
jgi:hypothetical protein